MEPEFSGGQPFENRNLRISFHRLTLHLAFGVRVPFVSGVLSVEKPVVFENPNLPKSRGKIHLLRILELF